MNRPLNRPQKVVIGLVGALFVLWCLWPPPAHPGVPLFAGNMSMADVDAVRWAAGWVVLAVALGAGVLLLGGPRDP